MTKVFIVISAFQGCISEVSAYLSRSDAVKELARVRRELGISNDALRFIAAMATGNMRTAETMLEQVASLDHGSPRTKDVKRFLQQKMNIGG
jgi:DNA polymerase III gamma/tau subunit